MGPVRHTERALVGEAANREHSSGNFRLAPGLVGFTSGSGGCAWAGMPDSEFPRAVAKPAPGSVARLSN